MCDTLPSGEVDFFGAFELYAAVEIGADTPRAFAEALGFAQVRCVALVCRSEAMTPEAETARSFRVYMRLF